MMLFTVTPAALDIVLFFRYYGTEAAAGSGGPCRDQVIPRSIGGGFVFSLFFNEPEAASLPSVDFSAFS